MTITTRARLALFLSIAVVLIAGIASAGSVNATDPRADEGGGDGVKVTGICVEPASPGSMASGPPPFGEECNDIDDPVVVDPVPCDEQPDSTDPDTPVSSCPGDEEPRTTDPGDDGADPVEPRPGMVNVVPTSFDHVDVGEDDRTLTVYFWSGVEPCYVLDRVDVAEGPATITLTLFQGSDPDVTDVACIDIALLKKVVVHVDEPVGARRIVDGAA